jgi:DeoR family transcriptional regulator, aga operon transcriptional repressor
VTTRSPSRLLVGERRRLIVELVDRQERATVEELVDRFGVSAVTIRGDLDRLAESGAIVRSHGGALKGLDQRDVPIAVKETRHHREKVRIAQAAAQLVRDHETVILDSGTTTAEIARRLKRLDVKALTVVTNGLNVAMELANLPNIRVILLGGLLRPMSYSTVGPQAEQALRGLYADRLFLGVDGLDVQGGLTTPDVLEAQLNALMIKVSREAITVADSSKFRRRSLSLIANVTDVQRIITDDKADPEVVASLRALDIDVTVV